MSDTKISEVVGIVGSMPGTEGFTMACFKADEVPVGTPLYLRPQPAELAEQQGDALAALAVQAGAYEYGDPEARYYDFSAEQLAKFGALAATGKQQVGDDGLPLVSVTQEFKDQADYDAEISSAASNLLRNNTLGLSGSLPEMVAALLKLASGQQVGEVQGNALVGDEMVQAFKAALSRAQLPGKPRTYFLKDSELPSILREVLAARQPGAQGPVDGDWHLRGYAYASKQATTCAGCGKHKHTPLRIDAMGGYVCLTCIDQKLGALLGEFGYPPAQGIDLGVLRELAESWKAVSDPDPTPIMQAHQHANHCCADELLALIDGRDAAPEVK